MTRLGTIFVGMGALFLFQEATIIWEYDGSFGVTDRALWSLIVGLSGVFLIWAQSILNMRERLAKLEARHETAAAKWKDSGLHA